MGTETTTGWGAVDYSAWATAGAVLMLLLTTNCDTIPDVPSVDVTCSVRDGTDSQEDVDAAPDTSVSCAANDSEATALVGGTALNTEAIANGSDSEASAGGTLRSCYEAGSATNVSVNKTVTNQRFEKFCPTRNGFSEVATSLILTKTGAVPVVVFDDTATIACDDGEVTSDGFGACSETIADTRFFCDGSAFITDVLAADEGDTIEAVFTVDSHSKLPPDAIDGDVTEARCNVLYQLSASNLTEVPCQTSTSCATNVDCTTPGDICLDDECSDLSFGSGLTGSVSIDPAPVFPGGSFSAAITFGVTEGDLLPIEIIGSVSDDALDINPGLSAGQIAGGCSIGALNFFLIATANADELFLDLNTNATFDGGDPLVTYGDDGHGDFVMTVQILPNGVRTTIAADATVTCNLQSLFLAGTEGTYPIHVESTSLDADNAGPDDGAGIDPLTFTSDDEDLVIGDGRSNPTCGDPIALTAGSTTGSHDHARADASGVAASDALFILRASIGLETCPLCVCDVDNNGSNSAVDALAVLRAAVGQPVSLSCPAC